MNTICSFLFLTMSDDPIIVIVIRLLSLILMLLKQRLLLLSIIKCLKCENMVYPQSWHSSGIMVDDSPWRNWMNISKSVIWVWSWFTWKIFYILEKKIIIICFYWTLTTKLTDTVEPVYNNHPRDHKIVAVVNKWSLTRGSFII